MSIYSLQYIKWILFIIIFFSITHAQDQNENPMTHVVVCWLNQDQDENDIADLIEEIKELRTIPGILELEVGRSIESDRAIVDDSFTIAISMKFSSTENMKSYLAHPTHVKFVNEKLKPNLEKIVVYDFEN